MEAMRALQGCRYRGRYQGAAGYLLACQHRLVRWKDRRTLRPCQGSPLYRQSAGPVEGADKEEESSPSKQLIAAERVGMSCWRMPGEWGRAAGELRSGSPRCQEGGDELPES